MKKATLLILTLFIFIPLVSVAQEWEFQGIFPADSTHPAQTLTHGLAVDPDGKLWALDYFARGRLPRPELGDTITVQAIFIFNSDGSEAEFSPIMMIELPDAGTDTLRTNARGMRAMHDGNILAAFGATLYLIDYQTGEGLAKMVHPNALSLTSPGADQSGNIYVGTVLADAPIMIYNVIGGEFVFTQNGPSPTGISRTIDVSPDGLRLYYCSPGENAVLMFTREDEFSEFGEVPDTILQGMRVESSMVNRANGNLWVSAGSNTELPNQYPDVDSEWEPFTWYGYDVDADEIVGSITWFNLENSWYGSVDGVLTRVEPWTSGAHGPWPRAVSLDDAGETIYVGHWTYPVVPAIQKWTKTASSVRPDDRAIVESFNLSQNYPNPFNPATEIGFTLINAGMTTLKVYDILGREVTTLVNEHLSAGGYTVTFDASNLTSGTYLYVLESQGQREMKKMMLVK
jgi:hypothetical protein